MKAYWIAKVNVDDNEAYAEYAKRVTPALAKYNGKFLVRGDNVAYSNGFTTLDDSEFTCSFPISTVSPSIITS